mmetsp:Transcript_16273/g.27305  ORF Transcript_16273/g.27305 Transcript_16273/m.27305 type:complete len:207 (-) Transcript_16273:112-732(-)
MHVWATCAARRKHAFVESPHPVVERDSPRMELQVDTEWKAKTGEDVWRPIEYWSRALSPSERSYSATLLECTGMHDAIMHWKNYLNNGIVFDVVVDHYALVYMVTKLGTVQQNQRLDRLCLNLQDFSFNVIHRKGKEHWDTDALSRLLRINEAAYINTYDDLRTDNLPLDEAEKKILRDRMNHHPESASDEFKQIVEQAISLLLLL